MKQEKIAKTNAMRLLDRAGMPYRVTGYDVLDQHNDGVSVAHKLGVSPALIYKTLVLGSELGYHVCLVSSEHVIDLKQAAKAFGVKRLDLIEVRELLPLTGYVKGGCSPIGMKKRFPTLIDEPAKDVNEFYISAGRIGQQIVMNPHDLVRLLDAEFARLSE